MKKLLTISGLVVTLLVIVGLFYLRSIGMFASEPVYATAAGAINGYDPVAYFDEQRPVKGRQEHAMQWNGATWYFSSADRLQRFKADPERYAPQFGGYCAMAVASGYTAQTDPAAFAIVDDRLYLNFDPSVLEEWTQKRDAHIASGQQNWPSVLLGH